MAVSLLAAAAVALVTPSSPFVRHPVAATASVSMVAAAGTVSPQGVVVSTGSLLEPPPPKGFVWAETEDPMAAVRVAALKAEGAAVVQRRADMALAMLKKSGEAVIQRRAEMAVAGLKYSGEAVIQRRADMAVAGLKYNGEAVIQRRAEMAVAGLKYSGEAVIQRRAEMAAALEGKLKGAPEGKASNSVQSWYDKGLRL